MYVPVEVARTRGSPGVCWHRAVALEMLLFLPSSPQLGGPSLATGVIVPTWAVLLWWETEFYVGQAGFQFAV